MERIKRNVELRANGRNLAGVVMDYGDVSNSHQERFTAGAFRFAESVPINLLHDDLKAIAWYPGGGVTLNDTEHELRFDADLPPIPAADLALELVATGKAQGLSIEFRAIKEKRDNGIRVIEQADLLGIAIVPNPAYGKSRVELRAENLNRLYLVAG